MNNLIKFALILLTIIILVGTFSYFRKPLSQRELEESIRMSFPDSQITVVSNNEDVIIVDFRDCNKSNSLDSAVVCKLITKLNNNLRKPITNNISVNYMHIQTGYSFYTVCKQH